MARGKAGFSKRDQQVILLAGALALVTVWLYAVYIVGPLRREAADIGRQIQTANQQLKALEASMSNDATLREQHRQLEGSVQALRSRLPAEGELSAVIELLTDLANQAQVKIQTISPQFPVVTPDVPEESSGKPADAPYKDVVIEIDAVAGYHQLGTFLSLIESGEKPMRVSNLRISGNPKEPKRSNIRLLVWTYVAQGGNRKSPVARTAGAN